MHLARKTATKLLPHCDIRSILSAASPRTLPRLSPLSPVTFLPRVLFLFPLSASLVCLWLPLFLLLSPFLYLPSVSLSTPLSTCSTFDFIPLPPLYLSPPGYFLPTCSCLFRILSPLSFRIPNFFTPNFFRSERAPLSSIIRPRTRLGNRSDVRPLRSRDRLHRRSCRPLPDTR